MREGSTEADVELSGELATQDARRQEARAEYRAGGAAVAANVWAVAVGTGILFVLVGLRFGFSWELPAFLYLAAVSVVLAVIDLGVKRLPNAIVLPSYVAAGVLLLLPAIAEGAWVQYRAAWFGAAVMFACYFLIAWIRPAGMGFGDVKLAGLLGLYLGWLGWTVLAVGAVVGFMAAAIVGVVLLVSTSAGLKTKIPFGPFMLIGAWVAILWGQPIVDWYIRIVLPS